MVIPGIKGMSLGQFGKSLYRHFQAHAVTDRAATLAYYFVFALFPLLFFFVTLTAYLPIQGAIDALLERAGDLVPDEALDIVRSQVASILHRPRPKLLTGSLIIALWSSSRGIDAIRTALNLAYDVKESRSWWKVQAMALSMTLASALLVLVAVALIIVGGKAGFWLAEKADFGREYLLTWSYLRWPVTALVIMLALALTYYVLPDVEQEFKFITPGSMVGSILWLLTTWGFTYYVEHFANYNVAYGSLAGVAILLSWMYIGGLIFIVGGEMNSIIEHASREGKEAGARVPGQAAPPPSERASAAPPGATKSATVARRLWFSRRRSRD